VTGLLANGKFGYCTYPNLPLAKRPVLHNEDLPIPRPPEMRSVDDENESDVKCNDGN
jgi:hypothetical protein